MDLEKMSREALLLYIDQLKKENEALKINTKVGKTGVSLVGSPKYVREYVERLKRARERDNK